MTTVATKIDMDPKEAVILALVAMLILPLVIGIEGAIMYCSWEWFAVPLGAVHMTLAHGCGLSVLLFATILRSLPKVDQTFAIGLTSLLMGIVRLLWLLLLVWVIHLFV